MGKQMFRRVKKTLAGLLLMSAILMIFGVGTVYAGSYDWMSKYLGQGTVDSMNQAERNLVTNSGDMDNSVNNWMVRNSGGNYVSGPYDWQRPYLGDATVNYLNAHQNDAIPSWANADTSRMSPFWAAKYNTAKADVEYYHNQRFSNLGRY